MNKTDQAKSITAKLSKLARARQIPYESFATTFLIERLLARLVSNHTLAKSLVFKGGYVGLRVYNSPRYTIDLDALLQKAEIKSTLKITLTAIESDLDDGTWFSFESQIDLKTQGEYGGIRQTFRAGIGDRPKDLKRSQLINFDLGIGDPITPKPVKAQTAELVANGELSWLVYPLETIVAEKLQTLIERSDNNSRAKDIYDLHHYLPQANAAILNEAVKRCFSFRGTQLPENLIEHTEKIDTALLKRGWKTAIASLRNPPTFEEAFETILQELPRIFSSLTVEPPGDFDKIPKEIKAKQLKRK